MTNKNIFTLGGELSRDRMIGYSRYTEGLKRLLSQKIDATGGIYVYGLYRTGKTSLIKLMAEEPFENTVSVYIDLAKSDTGADDSFGKFLEKVVKELKKKLKKVTDIDLDDVMECIENCEEDDKSSQTFRDDIEELFEEVKKAGIKVMLFVDEFDAASHVFKSKADFEFIRSLTASTSYSVCLITASRQELSMIEHTNPNNSSFEGVMFPFFISGFDDSDIRIVRDIMWKDYDFKMTDDIVERIMYYCGRSPYLWSCICYIIADTMMTEGQNAKIDIDAIFRQPNVISQIRAYHDKIAKDLSHDKDNKGCSNCDKLAATIFGPAFLVTKEDITFFNNLGYLIWDGEKNVTVSPAFKEYLKTITYSNDILNNFDKLERTLKELLAKKKAEIFLGISDKSIKKDKDKWYSLLSDAYSSLERYSFSNADYENVLRKNPRKTLLDIMSLNDTTRLIRANWRVFKSAFNNDTRNVWDTALRECGKARNPVHHCSAEEDYTEDEIKQINAYCHRIIKQIV